MLASLSDIVLEILLNPSFIGLVKLQSTPLVHDRLTSSGTCDCRISGDLAEAGKSKTGWSLEWCWRCSW